MAARNDYRSWGYFDSLHLPVLECVKEIIAKVLFQGPANRWLFILQLFRWQLRHKSFFIDSYLTGRLWSKKHM